MNITYYAEIDKNLFKEIEFPVTHEKVTGVEIKIDKGDPFYALYINFLLKNIDNLDDAEFVTRDLLNNLLIKIAVNAGVNIGEPRVSRYNIAGYGSSVLFSNLTVRQHDLDLIDSSALEVLRNELSSKLFDTSVEKNLYRTALQCKDVVSKFMALYLVLLYITRDKDTGEEKQKFVDKLIRNHIGRVASEFKPGPKRTESIFTRLRNQVGHFRGVGLKETRENMMLKIDQLNQIVWKEINK